MTGFGRAEGNVKNQCFVVETKSVNHRYLDLRFRLPSMLSRFEPTLASEIRAAFSRGSIELVIKQLPMNENMLAGSGNHFSIDQSAAESFFECCKTLHEQFRTPRVPSLEAIAMTGKIIISVEPETSGSEYLEGIRALVNAAVSDLKKMRAQEGEKLSLFLQRESQGLAELADKLSVFTSEQTNRIRAKLADRIKQWDLSSETDSQRLEWEVAYYAERSDITEEIDRLRSHLEAFRSLLSEPNSVGRKLDFLTQEMYREINTIGAKSTLLEVTRLTVEGKSIVEKLREQVQNVE